MAKKKSVKQLKTKNKKIVHVDMPEYYNLLPSWVFGQIDYDGPFGWSTIINNPSEFKDVLAYLSSIETMKWKEILLDSSSQNHKIKLYKLSKDAQKRLERINVNDIDDLISLRVTGKKRIFGIMNSGKLNLLWYDPEHKVCPSKLKHT